MRKALIVVSAVAAASWFTVEARADADSVFTPIHLVRQSRVIALLKCDAPDTRARMTVHIQRALKVKGKVPSKSFTIDLDAGKDREALTQHLVGVINAARKAGGPVLFFTGKYRWADIEGRGADRPPLPDGFVHVGSMWWYALVRNQDGSWVVDRVDSLMEGTWEGGTDMLLRCVQYVLSDPNADVPWQSGVAWRLKTKIATFAGTVRSLLAVDVAGNGQLALFAACDSGDRLLVYEDDRKPFKDVTAARGLRSQSREAVWGDFNGDRCVDLASWDGQALNVWIQADDGTFTTRRGDVALTSGCIGLAVLDVGVKGRPGLLVSTPTGPVLLVPADDGQFAHRALPPRPPFKGDPGKPGACVVADLDGDRLTDILQPFEKLSALYKGKGAGRFESPVIGTVALGEWPARACLGDFDHDGQLDIFVVARDWCKLHHNLGQRQFANRFDASGNLSYTAKPNGTGIQICDINNDGRQDVFITYRDCGPQIFFNRGFRNLEWEGWLIGGTGDTPGLTEVDQLRQQAGLVADFNGDGAQDAAIVNRKGEAWILYRDAERLRTGHDGAEWMYQKRKAAVARAALPAGGEFAGPLTVTGWAGKRCLGAWNVVAGSSEAVFGRGGPGPIELRWQFPGGTPQRKEILLKSKPVRVVLEPAR